MNVFNKIKNLPIYFKFLIIGILLLNFAAVCGLQERESIKNEIQPVATLLAQVQQPLVIEGEELVAEKQVFTSGSFGVGILEKPESDNYFYYKKNELEFYVDEEKNVIPYGEAQYNDLRLVMMKTLNDFVLSSFLITTVQYLMMISLVVVAIAVITLVISKFKLKIRKIVDAVFISMFPAILISLVSSLVFKPNIQMGIFAGILGVLCSVILRKDLDNRVTSYYLGEGVL